MLSPNSSNSASEESRLKIFNSLLSPGSNEALFGGSEKDSSQTADSLDSQTSYSLTPSHPFKVTHATLMQSNLQENVGQNLNLNSNQTNWEEMQKMEKISKMEEKEKNDEELEEEVNIEDEGEEVHPADEKKSQERNVIDIVEVPTRARNEASSGKNEKKRQHLLKMRIRSI